MLFRLLLMVHRWVGVALCVLFLLWFPSGIGMMYWGMPAVSASDRLERWPALDPATIVLSPQEAAERAGISPTPNQVRLNSYDGRPVYRLGGGGRAAAVAAAETCRSSTPTRARYRRPRHPGYATGPRPPGRVTRSAMPQSSP